MDLLSRKKEVVKLLYKNKILVTNDIIQLLNNDVFLNKIHSLPSDSFSLSFHALTSSFSQKFDCDLSENKLDILFDYDAKFIGKRCFQDFITFFNNRFMALSKLLQQRQEMKNLTNISHVQNKKERELVSFIGMVSDLRFTKNDNLIFKVEDSTGSMNVLISKSKYELFKFAKDIVLDDVIGFVGTASNGIVFANKIIIPDVPVINELKKAPEEGYFVVLSDIHVGSNQFLHKEFDNFLKWVNGNFGSDKHINYAKKLKYILIIGDLVDGIGIYPGQEDELSLPDIYDQYKEAARLLTKIPAHIKIIICPGNHDACRLAEPQPVLSDELLEPFKKLKNVTWISNPGIIKIGETAKFSGFKVLFYHGYSFDYYSNNVYSIKNSGKHISDRSDLVMKFLLRRRHLAPTYGSTIYTPDLEKDFLVIEDIPDFFLSGHIHKSCIDTYRGVSLISGSCFQSKTSFQEKVGHDPDPAIVPLVNMQTRQIIVLNFNDEVDEENESNKDNKNNKTEEEK